KLASIDDQVLFTDRTFIEPALQNLASSCRVARLRGKRCARDMGSHSMVRHRAPRMVLGRWLREPHIPGIAGQLSGPEGSRHVVAVADLPAGGVNEVSATFHLREQLRVEKILGF